MSSSQIECGIARSSHEIFKLKIKFLKQRAIRILQHSSFFRTQAITLNDFADVSEDLRVFYRPIGSFMRCPCG